MIICERSIAKTTFLIEGRQTCDHIVETSIKTIKLRKGPSDGWMGPHLFPCILSKKTGDSNVTLLKIVCLSIHLESKQNMGIH